MNRPLAVLHSPRAVLAGLGLPFIQYFTSILAALVLCLIMPMAAEPLGGKVLTGFVRLCALLPAVAVGLMMGRRRLPWSCASTVALWSLIGAVAWAWLLTDDVQAGVKMPPEWVRAEFLSILKGYVLPASLPAIGAMLAAMTLASRLRTDS